MGDIRGGKGLLACVELVEDRASKAPFAADKKVGPRVLAEMTKRGVITRARVEHIFFSPPLVVSEEQVDRLVSVTRDAMDQGGDGLGPKPRPSSSIVIATRSPSFTA